MKSSRAIAAALAAFAVLVIAAGCGGGESSSDPSAQASTATGSISKAELISKGDAICHETDKIQRTGMNAYVKKNPKTMNTKAAFIEMVEKVALPPVRTEIEKLAALGAPKGDEAKVAAIISGFEKAQQAAEGNASFAMGLTEGPFTAPDKLAAKYGFKACAKPL